jgi:hypothetical protein
MALRATVITGSSTDEKGWNYHTFYVPIAYTRISGRKCYGRAGYEEGW